MPSLVPPGYTRGPLLFLGPTTEEQAAGQLLQTFWTQAGGYGGRLLILALSASVRAQAAAWAAQFRQWETASVTLLPCEDRAAAMSDEAVAAVEAATAILLLGENPLRLASTLGGSPLAQAIRRANARSKAVGAVAHAAALLCQHILTGAPPSERATPHRHAIHFAPGLGLVNRLTLDLADAAHPSRNARLSRLYTAVAYNPFLVGVGLAQDAALIVYSDSTLESLGRHSALLVDGAGITATDVHDIADDAPLTLPGVQVHELAPGHTFNLDTRTLLPPKPDPTPPESGRITNVF